MVLALSHSSFFCLMSFFLHYSYTVSHFRIICPFQSRAYSPLPGPLTGDPSTPTAASTFSFRTLETVASYCSGDMNRSDTTFCSCSRPPSPNGIQNGVSNVSIKKHFNHTGNSPFWDSEVFTKPG